NAEQLCIGVPGTRQVADRFWGSRGMLLANGTMFCQPFEICVGEPIGQKTPADKQQSADQQHHRIYRDSQCGGCPQGGAGGGQHTMGECSIIITLAPGSGSVPCTQQACYRHRSSRYGSEQCKPRFAS